MTNVELLRQRCFRAVQGIAQFASMLPEGGPIADRLRGEEGAERFTRIIDFIMAELGHEDGYHGAKGASDGRTATMRAVRKAIVK